VTTEKEQTLIELYWRNATDRVVGPDHGVSEEDLTSVSEAIQQALATVVGQCRRGELGYAALPTHGEYAERVSQLRAKLVGGTTDLVVLGIGGSALGNIALQTALNPATHNLLPAAQRNGPRLFVLDNVDPAWIDDVLCFLDATDPETGRARWQTALFNVISKSGETAETASQFMIFREKLREKLGARFAERVVVTTDAEEGTLRDIAEADGYETLAIPDGVGGRFSVLSPVGLFSAAMCGIDIRDLLKGAAAMQQRVEAQRWPDNPAAMLAAIKYLMYSEKGKGLHVMMPYSNRLSALADWYRQLWAESLGKGMTRDKKQKFVGPTPIKALGATDQHSQVQLYREGENDRLVVFLQVDRHPCAVSVPDVFGDVSGMTYLRGADLGQLLNAEKKATEYALAFSERPSVTIHFDEISPATVGEFIYLYEFTTSLMGELLDVDAYDQPAVELGKQATFALMGREHYEEFARSIRRLVEEDGAFRI